MSQYIVPITCTKHTSYTLIFKIEHNWVGHGLAKYGELFVQKLTFYTQHPYRKHRMVTYARISYGYSAQKEYAAEGCEEQRAVVTS